MKPYDIAVIGGGIVGLATALALSEHPGLRLVVVEAEPRLAAHQTGNNSGVIHSGLYYKPGSLKAHNCVAGRTELYRFCAEHGIPCEACGKVVVATRESELPALQELERRGRENGLQQIRRLDVAAIREIEPHAAGIAGLWVGETGIVDFTRVAEAYAGVIQARGGEIRLGARVTAVRHGCGETVLLTSAGEVACRHLVNCAGLHSDRVARLCGVAPELQIIPFRGEYYSLRPQAHGLVRHLIYPVPDPRFPFLGVHFTRMARGGVEAGPNAVLAFKREGYGKFSFSLRDALQFGLYPGFWRMAWKFWRTGIGEYYRSFHRAAFVRALQRLVPEITAADLQPGGAGVRAQALEADGKLVDDFRIREAARQIHVLNAPSPAATASLSIGRTIAAMARRNFSLP